MRVTREEYLDLDYDGNKYDMIQGVLYMSPSAAFEHGKLQGRMFKFLDIYIEAHPIGELALETDIFLPDGGDVLRPDISVILNENMHKVKKHIHGAPDLVCEVLSPDTRHRDLGEKAYRYLANGVAEYWIIDPSKRQVSLWISAGHAWEKREGDLLESRLLPGFTLKHSKLFR